MCLTTLFYSAESTSSDQGASSSVTNGADPSEVDALKTTLAQKEKALADKDLVCKKAIATAKKIKFQLNKANATLEENKTQLSELTAKNESLTNELSMKDSVSNTQEVKAEVMVSEVMQQQEHSMTSTSINKVEQEILQTSSPPTAADDSILNMSVVSLPEDVTLELESLQTQLSTYKECCQQLQQQIQVCYF